MNLKTSITIIIGCLVIFLFVMLPIFISIEKKEDEYVKKFQGSYFLDNHRDPLNWWGQTSPPEAYRHYV